MRLDDEINKYFSIIHWSAVSFITEHDGRNSSIFRNYLVPSIWQDIIYGLRSFLGNTIKQAIKFFKSFAQSKIKPIAVKAPYIILITFGTSKYAGEEDQITEACQRSKINIIKIYPNKGFLCVGNPVTSFGSLLKSSDYIRTIVFGIKKAFGGLRYLFCGDPKARSLFASVVGSIQGYHLNTIIAKRLIEYYGRPQLALSLCPFAPASVAMIEYFKLSDILTAGIRTQSTSLSLEHLVINTQVLFAKSRHEKAMYQKVLMENGPILEEGCLLSLPRKQHEIAIDLPDRYILLLGTAKGVNQSTNDYYAFNDALFKMANNFSLPIVFKGHNLSTEIDNLWFKNYGITNEKCFRVAGIEYNHYLIEHASMVICAYSTLIYFIILTEKPLIIMHTSLACSNEFTQSPIKQLSYRDINVLKNEGIPEMQKKASDTLHWFMENYFLNKGPDYIVNYRTMINN